MGREGGFGGVVGATVAAIALAALVWAPPAWAQEEPFDGFHVGAALASQNVWGGSLVDDVDVLSQDRRTVVELSGGWRKQFGWFAAGLGLQAGFLDGDLALADPGAGLAVTYENSRQVGYGLTAGVVLEGRLPTHLYAYAFETGRTFQVQVRQGERVFRQKDKQGFLRYGIGAEVAVAASLHLRITAGTYRVDFGDRATNVEVTGAPDFTLGLAYQLGG